MNKTFPAVPAALARLGAVLIAGSTLAGCVAYYPDTYPAQPASQPYYGGAREPYYDPYYYGPSYNSTTVYYEYYRPGYVYRPGYGYYYPAPRPPPAMPKTLTTTPPEV